MRCYRAFVGAILAAVALSACTPPASPPSEAPAPAPRGEMRPWFICDGIDAPSVLVLRRSADETRAQITEYEKPSGAPVLRAEYALGATEGAAGSMYTPLLRDGAAAGNIRAINPGVLETPGAAYTPPFRSVDIGTRIIHCRWLPRTRLLGVGERRSFVVHEDADGDLIYSSYDFPDAAGAELIDQSENGRTTRFSLEVREGREIIGPGGAEFRFENDGYLYLIVVPTDGAATLEVWRGDDRVQSETLAAVQLGEGPTE